MKQTQIEQTMDEVITFYLKEKCTEDELLTILKLTLVGLTDDLYHDRTNLDKNMDKIKKIFMNRFFPDN